MATRSSFDALEQLADILVVGAGPSGLVTAAACVGAGFNVAVLDSNAYVGGWTCNIPGNTLAPGTLDELFLSQASFNTQLPTQPTIRDVQLHLAAYAAYHNVQEHVRLSCRLVALDFNPASGLQGRWWATFRNLSTGKLYRASADFVVLCTGHGLPENGLKEVEACTGARVIHANAATQSDVSSASGLVTVVGDGQEATDCASSVALLRNGMGVRQHIQPQTGQADGSPQAWVDGSSLLESARRRALHAALQPHYSLRPHGAVRTALMAPTKRRFWSYVKGKATAAKTVSDAHVASRSPQPGQPHVVLWAPSLRDPRVMPFLHPSLRTALLGSGESSPSQGASSELLYRGMLHPDVPRLAFVGREAHASTSLLVLELQAQWLVAHLTSRTRLPPAEAMRADVQLQSAWRAASLASPLMSTHGSMSRKHEHHYVQQLLSDLEGIVELRVLQGSSDDRNPDVSSSSPHGSFFRELGACLWGPPEAPEPYPTPTTAVQPASFASVISAASFNGRYGSETAKNCAPNVAEGRRRCSLVITSPLVAPYLQQKLRRTVTPFCLPDDDLWSMAKEPAVAEQTAPAASADSPDQVPVPTSSAPVCPIRVSTSGTGSNRRFSVPSAKTLWWRQSDNGSMPLGGTRLGVSNPLSAGQGHNRPCGTLSPARALLAPAGHRRSMTNLAAPTWGPDATSVKESDELQARLRRMSQSTGVELSALVDLMTDSQPGPARFVGVCRTVTPARGAVVTSPYFMDGVACGNNGGYGSSGTVADVPGMGELANPLVISPATAAASTGCLEGETVSENVLKTGDTSSAASRCSPGSRCSPASLCSPAGVVVYQHTSNLSCAMPAAVSSGASAPAADPPAVTPEAVADEDAKPIHAEKQALLPLQMAPLDLFTIPIQQADDATPPYGSFTRVSSPEPPQFMTTGPCCFSPPRHSFSVNDIGARVCSPSIAFALAEQELPSPPAPVMQATSSAAQDGQSQQPPSALSAFQTVQMQGFAGDSNDCLLGAAFETAAVDGAQLHSSFYSSSHLDSPGSGVDVSGARNALESELSALRSHLQRPALVPFPRVLRRPAVRSPSMSSLSSLPSLHNRKPPLLRLSDSNFVEQRSSSPTLVAASRFMQVGGPLQPALPSAASSCSGSFSASPSSMLLPAWGGAAPLIPGWRPTPAEPPQPHEKLSTIHEPEGCEIETRGSRKSTNTEEVSKEAQGPQEGAPGLAGQAAAMQAGGPGPSLLAQQQRSSQGGCGSGPCGSSSWTLPPKLLRDPAATAKVTASQGPAEISGVTSPPKAQRATSKAGRERVTLVLNQVYDTYDELGGTSMASPFTSAGASAVDPSYNRSSANGKLGGPANFERMSSGPNGIGVTRFGPGPETEKRGLVKAYSTIAKDSLGGASFERKETAVINDPRHGGVRRVTTLASLLGGRSGSGGGGGAPSAVNASYDRSSAGGKDGRFALIERTSQGPNAGGFKQAGPGSETASGVLVKAYSSLGKGSLGGAGFGRKETADTNDSSTPRRRAVRRVATLASLLGARSGSGGASAIDPSYYRASANGKDGSSAALERASPGPLDTGGFKHQTGVGSEDASRRGSVRPCSSLGGVSFRRKETVSRLASLLGGSSGNGGGGGGTSSGSSLGNRGQHKHLGGLLGQAAEAAEIPYKERLRESSSNRSKGAAAVLLIPSPGATPSETSPASNISSAGQMSPAEVVKAARAAEACGLGGLSSPDGSNYSCFLVNDWSTRSLRAADVPVELSGVVDDHEALYGTAALQAGPLPVSPDGSSNTDPSCADEDQESFFDANLMLTLGRFTASVGLPATGNEAACASGIAPPCESVSFPRLQAPGPVLNPPQNPQPLPSQPPRVRAALQLPSSEIQPVETHGSQQLPPVGMPQPLAAAGWSEPLPAALQGLSGRSFGMRGGLPGTSVMYDTCRALSLGQDAFMDQSSSSGLEGPTRRSTRGLIHIPDEVLLNAARWSHAARAASSSLRSSRSNTSSRADHSSKGLLTQWPSRALGSESARQTAGQGPAWAIRKAAQDRQDQLVSEVSSWLRAALTRRSAAEWSAVSGDRPANEDQGP